MWGKDVLLGQKASELQVRVHAVGDAPKELEDQPLPVDDRGIALLGCQRGGDQGGIGRAPEVGERLGGQGAQRPCRPLEVLAAGDGRQHGLPQRGLPPGLAQQPLRLRPPHPGDARPGVTPAAPPPRAGRRQWSAGGHRSPARPPRMPPRERPNKRPRRRTESARPPSTRWSGSAAPCRRTSATAAGTQAGAFRGRLSPPPGRPSSHSPARAMIGTWGGDASPRAATADDGSTVTPAHDGGPRSATASGGRVTPPAVTWTAGSDVRRAWVPQGRRTGTHWVRSARLHATATGPRSTTSHRASSSKLTRTLSRRPSARAGTSRRSRIRWRCQSSNSACGSRASSSQWSWERAKVSWAWGSGTS